MKGLIASHFSKHQSNQTKHPQGKMESAGEREHSALSWWRSSLDQVHQKLYSNRESHLLRLATALGKEGVYWCDFLATRKFIGRNLFFFYHQERKSQPYNIINIIILYNCIRI